MGCTINRQAGGTTINCLLPCSFCRCTCGANRKSSFAQINLFRPISLPVTNFKFPARIIIFHVFIFKSFCIFPPPGLFFCSNSRAFFFSSRLACFFAHNQLELASPPWHALSAWFVSAQDILRLWRKTTSVGCVVHCGSCGR